MNVKPRRIAYSVGSLGVLLLLVEKLRFFQITDKEIIFVTINF